MTESPAPKAQKLAKISADEVYSSEEPKDPLL
jgi:hypothetical protein